MNLFDLFVRIGVKDEASDYISGLAGKLGSGISAAASVATAAVGVAVSGIAALTAGAIKNYAEYEQLVGGVDTLFKESSQRVQEYAANAFETAGVSANTYKESVTSFSASLLQSLEGDTQAAADLADQALRDMSDNANKMGTDMQTIINTYQSLSRGNFAMLDNLKLGFGGTKAEMERLIATAAELDSSVKANDMSFGNLVQAIHVVQTEMGISGITMEEYTQLVESGAMTQEEAWALVGTTAKEAATTIQGSVNSMKAAWQNLLTGIADENADFEQLVSNFVDTAGIAAENILPRITIALQGAAQLITTMLPPIFEQLPAVVNDILPEIANAAVQVVQSLIEGISQNQGQLVETAFSAIMTLVDGIISVLPQLVTTGTQLIANLVIGLAQALPELIPAAVDMVMQIVQGLADNIDLLIDAALQLVQGIANGLIAALPVLIKATPEIISSLVVTLIENLPRILEVGLEVIVALVDGILQALPDLANAAVDIVTGLIQGIVDEWPNLIENLSSLVDEIIETVKSILGIHSPSTVFSDIGGNVADGFLEGFQESWEDVKEWVSSAIDGIVSAAKSAVEKVKELAAQAGEVASNIFADDGTINSGLEEAQKRGKTLIRTNTDNTTNITNNYNITTPKLSAADIIRETRYTRNRVVMVR